MIRLALILAATVPTIWSDGIHDDTDGFEALVCQQEVRYATGALTITYDATGRQHINVSREHAFRLPLGVPVPKHTENGVSLHLNDATKTYEVDCAARATS